MAVLLPNRLTVFAPVESKIGLGVVFQTSREKDFFLAA